MQSKIINEVKARSKADKITGKQVLMWAIQEESNRTQMQEAGQNDCQVVKANTCGSIHLPRRCPAFGMTCGECGRVNHFCTACRAPRLVASRLKEQNNGQTNKVKNDQFIHNYSYVKASIETKINTSSFYNSINIRYRLDTGRSSNNIPVHLYKKLFPEAANRYIRQPKTCKIKLMHNGKEKMCKFFVVHNGSLAVLGMQDIDKLGLLSINYSSKHRQVAEEDNKDNGKSPGQTEGGKCSLKCSMMAHFYHQELQFSGVIVLFMGCECSAAIGYQMEMPICLFLGEHCSQSLLRSIHFE